MWLACRDSCDPVLRAVRLIIFADFGRIDLDLRRQCVGRQRYVFDAHLFRNPEFVLVGIVVFLRGVGLQLDLPEKRIGRDHGLAHLALLLADAHQAVGNGARNEYAVPVGIVDVLHQQIAAQARLENRRRHALGFEHLLVTLQRKPACVLERRLFGDHALQLLVADGHSRTQRLSEQQMLADQIVHHREPQFRIIQQRGIGAALEHALDGLLPLAQCLVEFLLRDTVTAHRREPCRAVARAEIGIDAEKCERQQNDRENDLDQPLVVGDEVEHMNTVVSDW